MQRVWGNTAQGFREEEPQECWSVCSVLVWETARCLRRCMKALFWSSGADCEKEIKFTVNQDAPWTSSTHLSHPPNTAAADNFYLWKTCFTCSEFRQRYQKPRNVPLLSYFLGVGGWCWEYPWVHEDYTNCPQSIRWSLNKKTLLGSVCHFSHSSSLALKQFSMRIRTVLAGGRCWEIYGGIFGHPNDLRVGGGHRRLILFPPKNCLPRFQ